MIVLQIIALILLVDLVTGAVHWWEDTYGNPDWKFFGKHVVIPNIEHHHRPRKFLKDTVMQRIGLSLILAITIGVVLFLLGWFSWQVAFFLGYASLANEIHAMAHRSKKENGPVITFLQSLGILQSRRMHGYHHSAPYDVNYCVLTDYLNPVLTRIRFWEGLEWVIARFGIHPTRGSQNRGGYLARSTADQNRALMLPGIRTVSNNGESNMA